MHIRRTAFHFGGNVSKPVSLFIHVLLVCASGSAQVLFPGNSIERRSRAYDVIHYTIVVGFDEAEKRVDGTTSITLAPLTARLDSLELDAEDMDITSVSLARGTALRFANRAPKLVVFFDTPRTLTDTITISIQYSCKPQAGIYFIQPDSTNPTRHRQIWSQGEDTDNHFWFPCYDYPNDKATSEVIATVPESYELLSNGKLLKTIHDVKKHTKTFHWLESKPHSSYLIMIAAGEYEVVREHYGKLPLEYYVYKDRVRDGVRSLAKTAAAMKFFEEKIGIPYPWEKYAQIWISNFMWGGMENTSAVTLNDDAYLLDPRALIDFTADDVVAHELSHQWWGDLITSRDWNHLWLHEGFANYFTSLFKQDQKGDDYFQHDLAGQAAGVIATEDVHGRSPLVGKDGYTANIYSKGCWVLHMLRNVLGEQEFWRALRFYAKRYAFRNVDSHEFMLAIEDATGKNLGWFFEQWVYKGGHPKVSVRSTWSDDTNTLQLELTQTQAMDSLTGVFKFPLTIEATTSTGAITTTVFIEKRQQQVDIPLSERPVMIILDKGKNILGTFELLRTTDEFVYIMKHATDAGERIAAAKRLKLDNDDDAVVDALSNAALHDGFWAVRNEALLALAPSENDRVKQTLVQACKDKHSSVRTSAITALSRFNTPDVADLVVNAAHNDSSLLVLSRCLKVLAEIDSVRGFDLAVNCAGMESYRNVVRRAAMEALLTLKDVRALPIALTYSGVANPVDIRRQSVRLLGKVGRGNTEARDRLRVLLNDGSSSIRTSTVEALVSSGDDRAKDLLEQQKLVEKDEGVTKAIDQALKTLGEEP